MGRELLGEMTCPSGKLLLVDLGLLGLWSHGAPPLLPDWAGPPETVARANAAVDFRVEGPDARLATALFGLAPGWLYDRSSDFAQAFATEVAHRGLDARLVPAPGRVPHRERVEVALATPGRAGTVEFHGVWAPCLGDVPTTRRMHVYGTRMDEEEFAPRFRHVELEVSEEPVATTEYLGDVLVDHARLVLVDVDALAEWRHEDALDGRADVVFWGRDAEAVAAALGASALGEDQFGWVDLPIEEANGRGLAVAELGERDDLLLTLDLRPHSHPHALMAEIRASSTGSGTLTVGGARLCAFMTGWGDGAFPVEVDRAQDGSIVTLRVILGTAQAQRHLSAGSA